MANILAKILRFRKEPLKPLDGPGAPSWVCPGDISAIGFLRPGAGEKGRK